MSWTRERPNRRKSIGPFLFSAWASRSRQLSALHTTRIKKQPSAKPMAVFEPQSEPARYAMKRCTPNLALELVTDTNKHHFLRARTVKAERTDRCLCLLIYANRLASSVRGEGSLRAACFLVSAECVEIRALGQRVVRTDADLVVMSTR